MVSSRPQAHRSSSSFGNGSAASTILGAFGRRPRTATNSRDRQGQATDYAESTEDLSPHQAANRNRISLGGRSGLPRSNSSSQVHRVSTVESGGAERSSRFAFPSSPSFLGEGRRPAMTAQGSTASLSTSGNRPQTSGEESNGSSFIGMNRAGSSQGNNSGGGGGGGSAIGRYLRRYSQGAGKNMALANEAHAIASASNDNNAGSSTNSSRNVTSNYQSGSALTTSQTMPLLPMPNITGSPLHNPQELSNTEGAAASIALMTGNADTATSPAPATTTTPATELAVSASHRIRLVPHLEATRSLHFEPIERDLVEGAIAVKIGRFTDRTNASASGPNGAGTESGLSNAGGNDSSMIGGGGGAISASNSSSGVPGARGGAIPTSAGGGGRVDSGRIAFKSKVVSRGHAEVWCEAGGKFFIRDTKSSSGTFLNHIRLSHPNVESKPFPVKDGDVVQLGVDYQGGTEEIYRCVKMRVELNRGWQRGANQFNVNALRQLRALQGTPLPEPGAVTSKAGSALPTNRQSMNVTDCCICLFSVTVCQALFIAPCSHVFHFKCIRPLIEQHHPGFSCPLCRTFADLDADVEEDEAWQQALYQEARLGPDGIGIADVSTPMTEEPSLNLSSVLANSNLSSTTPVQANSTLQSAASSANVPRNLSSLRRAVLGSDDTGENVSSTRDDRRRSSTSSGSHQRRNENQQSIQPTTSSNTVISQPILNTVHSLRNVATPPMESPVQSLEEGEEDEEVIYEAPVGSSKLQNRRPSAPINIQSSNSPRVGTSNEGFTISPSLIDARTPQNEHFLSTLAEALPPSRYAIRAMEPVGDSTLFPTIPMDGPRRVSNATNHSSQNGTGDAFCTPAQGNSPPGGSSPLSATARSQQYDEEGNGGSNTSSSLAHNSKGKTPDNVPANMQGAIDFLAGDGSVATMPSQRARGNSLVGSVGSSDRGSSQNSRDISAPSKMAKFFKRNSGAVGN